MEIWRFLAMIYAALCLRCMAYKYRTDDLPNDAPPVSGDFAPVEPQATLAVTGQKAVCDACASDLKFVHGPDWATLTAKISTARNGSATPTALASHRTNVAPAAISELFRVEPGEDVKDMRIIAGDRILVVTSQRIVVVDPNLIGQEILG